MFGSLGMFRHQVRGSPPIVIHVHLEVSIAGWCTGVLYPHFRKPPFECYGCMTQYDIILHGNNGNIEKTSFQELSTLCLEYYDTNVTFISPPNMDKHY